MYGPPWKLNPWWSSSACRCRGGARSPLWRQIFADVFGCAIVKTAIDQQAAPLGAAALALAGVGISVLINRLFT